MLSPGVCVEVRLSKDSPDAEWAVLTAVEALAAAGAATTDVDDSGPATVALGLFVDSTEARAAGLSAAPPGSSITLRTLPTAEAPALPDLARRPVTIDGLTIADKPRPGDARTLAIEGGGAFGVGLHPTTAMMLALSARAPANGPVLDVGTGTGILALAQLLRGASLAVGTDIAPAALTAARSNAARAGLADRFTVRRDLPSRETFPLVLANLRTHILVALAPAITATIAPDGRALLSGIRFYEDTAVEAAFARVGAHVRHRAFTDGWWCLEVSPA